MPNWGPVSVSIGPGASTPDGRKATLFDTGTFALGSIPQVTGTETVTFAGGRSDAVYSVHAVATDASGSQIVDQQLVELRLTTSQSSWTFQVPFGTARIVIEFRGALYQGQTMTCVANGNTSTAVHCEFGTQRNTNFPATLIWTNSNILQVLTQFGAQPLSTAFDVLIGRVIDVTGLCTQPPGQLPAINTTLWDASPDERNQVLTALAWYTFCQCVPGTPSPVPFPPPVVTVPTDAPTAPVFTCNGADLCSSLIAIQQQLAALAATVANDLVVDTLQQRYRLPFAYIPGATHSNLSLAGQFQTSRLLGVRVAITAKPDDGLILQGNPPYNWNMGWLSIVNDDGMFEEKRLTRDLQIWFPPDMPQAKFFQWDLYPGVVIAVTELEAEP